MKEKEKYSKALGKRIRSLREAKNISLKEFESLTDLVDRHDLSRIENGKKVPSSFTLYNICKALDIPLSKLFDKFEQEIYSK